MTVDVDPPFSSAQNAILENGLTSLLNLLDRQRVKATFFVPAIVAVNFPENVREIINLGHEVGCHGFRHDPLEVTLNLNKQVKIVKTATKIIESVTGLKPIGFRAPLFKCNYNCWIALQKNNYVYDSSYVCSPFYASIKPFFGVKPFRLKFGARGDGLLEIPVSVNPFLPFPLGGGWFRIFGLKWGKVGVKTNFIFETPVVFYIHPKDVAFKADGFNWSWYYFKNATNCIQMIEEIISYARNIGTKFLKACELAELLNRRT